MEYSKKYFTERMMRIIKNAENEAKAANVLMPIHLLIACLQEKTGVLGEILLKSELEVTSLRAIASNAQESSTIDSIKDLLFNIPVSKDVQLVFQEAMRCMKRYNQVFVNEGHFLKALLTTKVIDHYLSEDDK